jgi:hypothetical protein
VRAVPIPPVRAAACSPRYNMMIPYLCPELPAAQKEALHSLVKTPLVYTSVALRNWRPFERLKLYRVYAPGSYHSYFHLNQHVDIGAYKSAASPDDPTLVHMVRTPCRAGLPEHEQNRAGRAELLRAAAEARPRDRRGGSEPGFYRFAQRAKNARFVPVKLTVRDALIRRSFLTAI